MIIACPKCRTEFEVGDAVAAGAAMRFKCVECGFVWGTGDGRGAAPPHPEASGRPAAGARDGAHYMDKGKLMHGLGVSDSAPRPSGAFAPAPSVFTFRTAAYFLCGAVFVCMVAVAAGMVANLGGGIAGVFERREEKKSVRDALYVELSKPLTLVKEGSNEYVIMSGFVYNPSTAELPVPKLAIRLENKDGRLLQEQEREIEAKTLPPLGKADFRFKVYKFSDQIVRFVVDLEEEK